MCNSIYKKIIKLSALTMFFLSLFVSASFGDSPYSGSDKVAIKSGASEESIKISEPEIASASGIIKIEEGYPIEGKIAADKLRLRTWPWGAVVGKYGKGTSVKVLGESGEFYLVEVDGKQGYMHKSYISTDKVQASFKSPSYPGDTKSGGYIALSEGIKASNEGIKKQEEQKDNSGSNNSNPGTSIDNSSSDYTGVTKIIFDIVKKFCQANQQYVLGAAHSKNSGYVTKSDCSGFTGQFINKLSELAGVKPVIGNSFPTSTEYANSAYTKKVTGDFPPTNPRDLIKPGDIFVMPKKSGGYGHVGVFMGYNSAGQPLIAHSTTSSINSNAQIGNIGKTGVRVEVIPSSYKNRWMGIYRLNNMDQIVSNLESK